MMCPNRCQKDKRSKRDAKIPPVLTDTIKTKIEIKGRQAGNSDNGDDLNEFRLQMKKNCLRVTSLLMDVTNFSNNSYTEGVPEHH